MQAGAPVKMLWLWSNIEDSTPIHVRAPAGLLGGYERLKQYLDEAAHKNLKSLDLVLTGADQGETPEVEVVQDLHLLIKENNTLESVCVTIQDSSNCIAILDSWVAKSKIDTITINCHEELSKEAKKHIKLFKRINIFKTIQVYITLKPAITEQSRFQCVIF